MTPITSPDSRSVIRKLNFPGGKVQWIHFSVNQMESLVLLVLMVLGGLLKRDGRRGLRPVGSFGMRADSADGFCVGGEGRTVEEAWGAGCGVSVGADIFFLRRSCSIYILNLDLKGISGCFSITRSLGRTFWWFG
jgi:hypothetical protein